MSRLSDDQLSVLADAAYGCDGLTSCDECGATIGEDTPCEVCDPEGYAAFQDQCEAEARAWLGHEIHFVPARHVA